MTARLVDCSIKDYHADAFSEVPTLNFTTAKAIATESLAHAYCFNPRLGGRRRTETNAKDEGSAIHKLILGVGADIDIIHADSYRTNAAKEARDRSYEAGRTPVIASKYEELESAAAQIRIRMDELGINFMEPGSVREQPVTWQVMPEESGWPEPIACRAMFDFLHLETVRGRDLKSISCAHPEKVKKQIVSMAYDMQFACYSSFLENVAPDMIGKTDFRFVFVELAAPYGILPVIPTESLKEFGRMRWRRALQMWGRALRDNRWPAYVDPSRPWMMMDAPNWALMAEMEQQDDEDEDGDATAAE